MKSLHTLNQTKQILRDIGRALLNLVYPPLCVICHSPLNACECAVCSHCGGKLSLYRSERFCAEERLFASPIFRNYFSLYTYRRDSPEQSLIHAYKYAGARSVADFLVKRASLSWAMTSQDYDLVLAIPLTKQRLSERGFNQALLIAQKLAQLWGIEASDDYIIRNEDTMAHARLTGLERRIESQGLFRLNPQYSPTWMGKRILLVDDVLTTGSTLLAYLMVLEGLGIEYVDVFTPMASV